MAYRLLYGTGVISGIGERSDHSTVSVELASSHVPWDVFSSTIVYLILAIFLVLSLVFCTMEEQEPGNVSIIGNVWHNRNDRIWWLILIYCMTINMYTLNLLKEFLVYRTDPNTRLGVYYFFAGLNSWFQRPTRIGAYSTRFGAYLTRLEVCFATLRSQ